MRLPSRLLPLALIVLAGPAWGAAPDLEARVARLERLVNTGALVKLLQQVEAVQRELRALRGELEEQSHGLDELRQHQRELYLDVDRRLQRLEAGGLPAAASEVPAAETPPVAAAPPAGPTAAPPPEPAAPPAVPAVDPLKEQKAYQRAFNLLKEGRYPQAAKAFKAFLAEYSQGSYADNAQYWLGEAYYVTRQFRPALKEFQRMLERYPKSPKLGHAMLKLGYIQDELGETAKALKTLNELIKRFPKTTSARLARERLAQMKGGTR